MRSNHPMRRCRVLLPVYSVQSWFQDPKTNRWTWKPVVLQKTTNLEAERLVSKGHYPVWGRRSQKGILVGVMLNALLRDEKPSPQTITAAESIANAGLEANLRFEAHAQTKVLIWPIAGTEDIRATTVRPKQTPKEYAKAVRTLARAR